MPSELGNHPLYWKGPPWLKEKEENWPEQLRIIPSEKKLPELRKIQNVLLTNNVQEPLIIKFPEFSSWNKIVRSFAYVLRFIKRKSKQIKTGPITVEEFLAAENKTLLLIQKESFGGDIDRLKRNEKLKNKSKQLKRLNPYIGVDDLMHAQGRLTHAPLPESARYPIILPSHHRLVRLLVEKYHKDNMHAPSKLLMSLLRQRFWIMTARRLMRSVFQSCIACFKVQPRNELHMMDDLPAERVQLSPTFFKTALDFCGHFNVKIHQTRFAAIFPVYVCVLVCMSTKAVHLEMVSRLSTDAFVAALHRFVSRRGKPAYIYCDNASNFQGAANRFIKLLNSEDSNLIRFSHENKLEFHFNVPLGPHLWGGFMKQQ